MSINKIAIVEPVGGHGGLDFYNLGLSEAISSQKIKVYLYTSDTTTLDTKIESLQTTVQKYYKNIYTNGNKYIRGLRYIYGSFHSLIDSKVNKVQIIHFHIYNFSKLEIFNIKLFKLFGFKIVATIHDVDKLSDMNKGHSKKIYRMFENLIDKVIVHTDYTKNALEKKFMHMNKDDIVVVPHGDMDFVYNSNVNKENSLDSLNLEYLKNKKIILLFGQIKKVKGLDILLEGFGQIKNKHKDAIVIVAGKLWNNDESEYIDIIQKYDMQDQVYLHLKFIDNKDVPLYFKAADIVVLPYKKIYNSGVVLRAMDYESTILVSDLEPLTKVISHTKNGYVFKSENTVDIATKLDELLSDSTLREKLKSNAKQYIQENFSWNIIGEKTVEIYKSMEEY